MRTIVLSILILAGLTTIPAASAECVDAGPAVACADAGVGGFANAGTVSVTTADGDSARASGHTSRDFFGVTRAGTTTDVDVADSSAGTGTGVASAQPPSVLNRVSLRVTVDGEDRWVQVRDANHDGVPEDTTTPELLP